MSNSASPSPAPHSPPDPQQARQQDAAAAAQGRRSLRLRSPGRRRRGEGPHDRLVGIDIARGLAVLGMFVVHVGLGWTAADGSNALYPLVSGRAAALFALLSGVSIALLSGGPSPASGRDMGVALWRVVVRGLVMLPLGAALTVLGTPVSVILAYYAVFFVLAVPLMDERWQIVAGTAAVLGVVGPVVSFWVRAMIADGPLSGPVATVNAYDPLVSYSGEGAVDFLLTGSYPALTWMPFVLAGLAIGRLDLRSVGVRWALVGVGAGVAVAAYAGSWIALVLLGGRARLEASFTPGVVEGYGGAGSLGQALSAGFAGTVPVDDWAWLLVAAPHSGTPFEVLGAGGAAVAVLGVCLLAAGYVRLVLYPVAAVGALALTTYVGHVLLIWAVGRDLFAGTGLVWVGANLAVSVLVGSLAAATVWRLLVGRGPLEWPLHAVSVWVARRIP